MNVGRWLAREGFPVPAVHHVGQTLLLLEDIGDTTLWLGGMTSTEPGSQTAPAVEPPTLTRKQSEVLHQLCRPQARDPRAPCSTTKEIAARMYVGEAAIKAHLGAMFVVCDIPEAGQNRRAILAQKAWDSGSVRQSDYSDADFEDE